ncbi:DUF2169 domain-containing protein [Sorangium sp. So ce1151]|uniref:DUF2169 family type VI secretion system accessory protein n=1 Tax=Sorangium sp. So ce1151 TaxID=3133332 RepID=UPI003F61BAD2
MLESALPRDAVIALPGTTATAVAWRTAQGQLHLTAIVKATFAFAPDVEMPLAEPQPINRAEVHHGNNPIRGIRFSSDLAPYLGRADVTFTGHAHAPRGTRVQSMPVRLAIADGSRLLLDRQLLVRDPGGFERMPLTCDRATSGAGGQENPFGRGPDPAAANLLDPRDPSRPACFGPVARALPARRRRLGSTPRKVLEAPIAEIPEGFDWGYFQAAPEGQQIDHLRGDEWIVLEGLHPGLPRVAMRLPSARGAARIHGLGGFGVAEGLRLDLVADTLHIDGDEERCTVVWRRSLPLPHAGALAAVRIVAGVEVAGAPIAWEPPPSARRAEAAGPPVSQRGLAGTIVMAEEPVSRPRPAETMFLDLDEAPATTVRPVTPFKAARAPHAATVALGPDEDAAASVRHALPFDRSSGPCAASARLPISAAAPTSAAAPLHTAVRLDAVMPLDAAAPLSTLALSPDDDARASASAALPFPATPRPAAEWCLARPAPIPGAPWSTEGASAESAPPAMLTPSAPPASSVPPAPSAPPAMLTPSAPPASSVPPAPSAPSAMLTPSAPSAPPPPSAPPAPSPLGAAQAKAPADPVEPVDLGVERYATIAAQLLERRAPRADVLGAHGLSEARFAEIERRWSVAMDDEDRRGGHALRDAYDAAYIKEWEAHRGPFELGDYARLTVAAERGHLAAALDAIGVRRTLWMRLKRVWAKRLAESRSLAGALQRELARQRELRSADAHGMTRHRLRAPGS